MKLLEVMALAPSGVGDHEEMGRVVARPEEGISVGVCTGRGVLGLQRLQLEGRRPASADEFLRGTLISWEPNSNLDPGTLLTNQCML